MRFPFFRPKPKPADQPGKRGPAPKLETGAATDPGRKRSGEPNQDAFLVLPAKSARPPLFLVADGMGGHADGAEASRRVIDAAVSSYKKRKEYSDMEGVMKDCLLQAHRDLAKRIRRGSERESMGSTIVMATLDGGQVHVANVGDSRAYLLHGEEISQLSFDHSVVADQVRAGRMTPLQALQSPLRNRLTQSITPKRASIAPFTARADYAEGDTLLLCSDGLWGVVTEAVMQMVARELDPQAAADKLVALALARGAPDNVTVVIARRGAPPPAEIPAGDTEKTVPAIRPAEDSDKTIPGTKTAPDMDKTLPGAALRGKNNEDKTIPG